MLLHIKIPFWCKGLCYTCSSCAGLVKILKKYDKRTGSMIRLPFVQKVLQQPFFTTDLLYKLVKECEEMLDQLMPTNEHSVASEDGKDDSEGEEKGSKPSSSSSANGGAVPGEAEDERSTDMKSTVTAALRALREIRSGSSTVSVFSLPPLHGSNGQDEPGRWKREWERKGNDLDAAFGIVVSPALLLKCSVILALGRSL